MNAFRTVKLLAGSLAALLVGVASAQEATPATPGPGSLTDFQFAGGYGPDGYKTWDILGQKAQTATEANSPVVITGMKLYLYAGGPALAIETRIESAQATVATGQGMVKGNDELYIYGANNGYQVTGKEWSWDGNQQIIHLGRSVYVTFIAEAANAAQPAATPAQPIKIFSDVLDIYQETADNKFLFSGNVTVANGDSLTKCQHLEVIAQRSAADNPAAPAAARAAAPPAALGVGHVEHIMATEQVSVSEGDLAASGQQAEMFPNEQRVVMSGAPQMKDHKNDTILEGGLITWLRDRQEIQVDPPADAPGAPGRVRVSMPPLSSSQPGAPPPAVTDASRLIITGESLRAQFGANQRNFVVEKFVRIEDTDLVVEADHLDAQFDPEAPAPPNGSTAATSVPTVGKLNHLAVNGNVTIRQPDLVTTTPRAEIFPARNEIVLSGGPQVVDTASLAVMEGEQMTISHDGQTASVTGSLEHPTKLSLPTIPGLDAMLGKTEATTVTSDRVIMQRIGDASIFTFSGNVHALASDLDLKCRTLDVDTDNSAPAAGADSLSRESQMDKIQALVARDQVEIAQRDYHAHAARAEIYPRSRVAASGAEDGAKSAPYRSVQLFGDPAGVTGPVRPQVELPPLQGVNLDATPSGALTATANTAPTLVTSDEQWLLSSPTGNTYYFNGNVQVNSGILQASCDQMRAFGSPAKEADPAKPSPAGMVLDRILSDGQVRIVQGTTVSTAGHAEITPGQHIATLSQNAQVVDPAHNLNLNDADIVVHLDTHRAEAVRPPPVPGQTASRPTIILPAGAMNFDKLMKPGNKPAAGSSP